ncbi:DUF1510 family protein [Heyndrickxia acidiproducens]|uniref:DUF1510 family protein n=1 Tax=Heyndrickxia acidiproducens TaxID=1121084 RepID=UPI00037AC273|nr:DUF1510 family protein [Heyndrickxia acidiproducens]
MADYYSREERKHAMQKSKRRKTNLILNTLIVIVIALICIVAYSIFFAGSDNEKTENRHKTADKTAAVTKKSETDSSKKTAEKKQTDKKDSEKSGRKVTKSTEPNVKEEITDSGWKPVGTRQTSGHVYSADSSSIDWQEKLKALSYATGIPEDNMTVWYLERGATTDEAIGTVSEKNNSTTYRVYLTWVDGKGWKPTKIYALITNDKN